MYLVNPPGKSIRPIKTQRRPTDESLQHYRHLGGEEREKGEGGGQQKIEQIKSFPTPSTALTAYRYSTKFKCKR